MNTRISRLLAGAAFILSAVIVMLIGAGAALAVCTPDAFNVECTVFADTYTETLGRPGYINGNYGNDILTVAQNSYVGNESMSTFDGVFGGYGDDAIYNYGTINGNVGIDAGGASLGDYALNLGTINAESVGMLAQDNGSTLVNSGVINTGPNGVGISCSLNTSGEPGCTGVNSTGGVINGFAGMTGDDGNDTFINQGVINANPNSYAFSGDVGSDSLVNSGTINGSVSETFNDFGFDTLVNTGRITGNISLEGGNDSLANSGRVGGGAFGGLGNDTLINSLGGSLGGMDGGADNDRLSNSSLIAGVMVGGAGNDTILNFGGGLANYLGGDAGNDSLYNGGAVNTSVAGGVGSDTITNNAGAVASWLDGGADNDRVTNSGFVNANLIGGAGNDSVTNLAGAFAAQMYGDAGMDTVTNGGFINGELRGGDDNDIVVNLGGAQATNISGDFGNDSVFNGGYLVGQLYGGEGNDTVVNAAFSYSAGAQLGGGDDQFVNGGYLNGLLDCGAGNDSVSVGGIINGAIDCGTGNDFVSIFNGVVAGQGASVNGVINGGVGVDGLVFNFTVSVASQQAATDISNAIAAASPAGGTIVIAGITYSWVNFEALYNLLAFNINEPVIITFTVTRRVNDGDTAAPVAVYCAADAVELWTIGADGVGSFAFSVPLADVNTGTTVSAQGVTFTASGGGSFSVSATASDGKPYSFTGSCS